MDRTVPNQTRTASRKRPMRPNPLETDLKTNPNARTKHLQEEAGKAPLSRGSIQLTLNPKP
jgi:hypothetical protein